MYDAGLLGEHYPNRQVNRREFGKQHNASYNTGCKQSASELHEYIRL
jgi:hypothetical protein